MHEFEDLANTRSCLDYRSPSLTLKDALPYYKPLLGVSHKKWADKDIQFYISGNAQNPVPELNNRITW